MEPVARYREYLPCAALRAHVSSLFSFVPGSTSASKDRVLLRDVVFDDAAFCAPQLADAHASMVFELGRACQVDGHWCTTGVVGGTVLGPMTRVGRTESSDPPEMIGVYFRPAAATAFFGIATSELADLAVDIEDLWAAEGMRLAERLSGLDEGQRIDSVEAALVARLGVDRRRTRAFDAERLATYVRRRRGRVTVEAMARAVGISRQHLTREFRASVGVSPKLYSRLARFQAGLVHAGRGAGVDWATSAAEMGYADQSHLIAEFREFSGLTPQVLATRQWFHPFIERAKSG
jgi:AraC-like DNA-binding protein